MLLLCRTEPRDPNGKKTAGMTLLFAPMDRAKIQIRPIPKMGRNAVDTNELFIDDLFVADEDVVGEPGHGFRTILGGLNAERVISANAALGIGKAALRRGTAYANQRVVFGRPIGQNQGISFQLAEAQIRLDAAEAVVAKAAWLVDRGMPCGREANAGEVPRRGGRLLRRRRRAERARRFRLRQGVPRRAVLPGGAADAHRADQPGDGPQLRRRARARAAAQLLRGEKLMVPYRSVLFLPGHKPAWVDKALDAGADCIVLDLEDSVPAELKVQARQTVAESIARVRGRDERVGLLVRVNPLDTRLTGGDLEAVVVPGLTGVFPPKISRATDVLRYDALVDHFEERNGVSGLEYIVPVEMVGAISAARDIAMASPRVGAMIGPTAEHADIARAVGYQWTPEGEETLYLRSRILLACREAGIHPLTGLWERLDDLAGLRTFAEHGRQLGFRGMVVIHPSHVPVVNEAFTPSAADVDFHQGLVDAYEAAAAQGHGALRYRGVHIDAAHADTARDWLAHARSLPGAGHRPAPSARLGFDAPEGGH